MKFSIHITIATVGLGLVTLVATQCHAVSFSIDAESALGFTPDDILGDPGAPFPAHAAPLPAIPFTAGIAEVDAFSFGELTLQGPTLEGTPYFSVDSASTGLPRSVVAAEAMGGAAGAGDHPADVFSQWGGQMVWDGNGLANPTPGPNLGLTEPIAAGPFDNVDGLDMLAPLPSSSIYWSVDPATVAGSAPYLGFSAADIFVGPAAALYSNTPVLYAGAGDLGLVGGDDIDALNVFENDGLPGFTAQDVVLFSLAPGSPSLLSIGPFRGGGASAADILVVGRFFGSGDPVVLITAGELGLLRTDNIDALDWLPEPGSAVLMGMGVITIVLSRPRRKV